MDGCLDDKWINQRSINEWIIEWINEGGEGYKDELKDWVMEGLRNEIEFIKGLDGCMNEWMDKWANGSMIKGSFN